MTNRRYYWMSIIQHTCQVFNNDNTFLRRQVDRCKSDCHCSGLLAGLTLHINTTQFLCNFSFVLCRHILTILSKFVFQLFQIFFIVVTYIDSVKILI